MSKAPCVIKLLRKTATVSLALAVISSAFTAPSYAQKGRKLAFVRDAETEQLLRDYTKPILKAAGLNAGSVEPVLINDKSFNAFVADGRRIFMNVGVIIDADTPNEVIGVLAHETGHIAGNHLVRLRQAASRAQLMAVIGSLLGAGAIAAGASSGSGGVAQGGAAIIGGGASVAKRSLLSYQRSEEISADRAAVTYLQRTGQSAKGMIDTFRRMAGSELFSAKYSDPYAVSHPMPRERISRLETLAKKSKHYNAKDPKGLQLRHDLVRAKLIAFTSHPKSVARRYPKSDKSLPADYARAVAAMRGGNINRAVKSIDRLIKRQPKNPYFWELKGQALIEAGRAKKAIAPFKQALALAPSQGQLQIWYGYALVASEDDKYLPAAVKNLQTGLRKDPNSPLGFRQLAIAKSRMGRNAEADVATAQGLMLAGDVKSARQYANRAMKRLKRGSREWILAEDIMTYKPPKFRR
ncbi:MAG: M48 family metalloprotease [Stappiaceae bacterium]